jgi:hypothetical protein
MFYTYSKNVPRKYSAAWGGKENPSGIILTSFLKRCLILSIFKNKALKKFNNTMK